MVQLRGQAKWHPGLCDVTPGHVQPLPQKMGPFEIVWKVGRKADFVALALELQ